jgi:transposase
LTNQLRAVLLERGLILPKRRAPMKQRLNELMAGEVAISPRALRLLRALCDEWLELDRRIKADDDELAALTREDDLARRLATIPGIGVINATALLAAVGDAATFGKGRDLAAWLGLTPRQPSTGGRTKLLGISKRGNTYLRTQLIHGARAAMVHLAAKPNRLGAWLRQRLARAHPNVVVVALAAKLARTAPPAPPGAVSSGDRIDGLLTVDGRCCATGASSTLRPPWPEQHTAGSCARRS